MFGRPLSSFPISFHSRWNTVHGTLFSLHGTGVALVTAARFQFGQFVLIVPDRKKAKLFPPPSLRPPTSLALLFFVCRPRVPSTFPLGTHWTALWDREPRNGNFPKRLFNSRAEFVSFSPERAVRPMLLVKATVFHSGTRVFHRSTGRRNVEHFVYSLTAITLSRMSLSFHVHAS